MSVRGPGYEYAEGGAGEDIEGVVAGVHDASAGDEGGAERGNHDDKGPPHFALGVQNMQLCGEVQREVEEAGERDWAALEKKRGVGAPTLPLLWPEGKLLKPSCRM